MAVSCIVASVAKTPIGPDHLGWKCISGGVQARTAPPKEGKVDTSSAEPPTAQALVTPSRSKVPDDNLADDDPDLLNFDTVGRRLFAGRPPGCRGVVLTQGNWMSGLVF
jgi:hypothetical protein